MIANMHVPWLHSDLVSFKEKAGSFGTNPQKTVDFLRTLFQTHNPAWQDIKVMLPLMFSEVEINNMAAKTREKAERRYVAGGRQGPKPDIAFLWPTAPA